MPKRVLNSGMGSQNHPVMPRMYQWQQRGPVEFPPPARLTRVFRPCSGEGPWGRWRGSRSPRAFVATLRNVLLKRRPARNPLPSRFGRRLIRRQIDSWAYAVDGIRGGVCVFGNFPLETLIDLPWNPICRSPARPAPRRGAASLSRLQSRPVVRCAQTAAKPVHKLPFEIAKPSRWVMPRPNVQDTRKPVRKLRLNWGRG